MSGRWGSGDDYAERLLNIWLGDPAKQLAPGQIINVPVSANMVGKQADLTKQGFAYGYDNTIEDFKSKYFIAEKRICLQATNYAKKVELRELSGSALTFSVTTWLRVYREIYYPSTQSGYLYAASEALGLGLEKVDKTKSAWHLPFVGTEIFPNGVDNNFGNGSARAVDAKFPSWTPYPTGPVQMCWVFFTMQNGTQRGAMFDFFQPSSKEWNESQVLPPTDVTPKSGLGGLTSKGGVTGGTSAGKDWSATGLMTWGSNGLPLGIITGEEFSGKTYYLADVFGADAKPKTSTSSIKPYGDKALSIVERPRTILGTSANNKDVRLEEMVDGQYRTDPTSKSLIDSASANGLSIQHGQTKVQLFYANLWARVGFNGGWVPLFFNQEAANNINEMIARFRTKSAETPSNLTGSGGIKIIATGETANYVKPSYEFHPDADPGKLVNGRQVGWRPVPVTGSKDFLPTRVIDGSSIGEILTINYETWIPPYQPGPNPTNAHFDAARRAYWYVLPTQARDTKTIANVFTPNGTVFDSDSAVINAAFGSGAHAGAKGLHWGKFLKKEILAYDNTPAFLAADIEDDPNQPGSKRTKNSQMPLGIATIPTGYPTSAHLSEWVSNLSIEASNRVQARLQDAKAVAYTLRVSGRYRQTNLSVVDSFEVSLANIEGLSYNSSGRMGTFIGNSGSLGRTGYSTPGAGANDPNDSDDPGVPGSGGGYTGTPRDWRKTISDSLEKLVTPSTVITLTGVELVKFIGRQVKIGAPLPLVKELFLENLLEARIVSLMNTEGISRKAAKQKVKNDPVYLALVGEIDKIKKKDFAGPTGGTNSGSSTPNESKKEQTIRIQVVRGLPGYIEGNRVSTIAEKPELVQVYEAFGKDGELIEPTEARRFVFPLTPREVNYTGIGTKWTEIERTGNYPIVDWQGFQLLKISFNFDLVNGTYAGNASRGPATGFGFLHDCEKDIETLRQMAQAPYPVTFLNMDRFMENEVRWPTLTEGRGIEFVIAEFNVTAVQRTPVDGLRATGAVANRISRATCSMTLQEIPIENVNIVQMPRIKPCFKILPNGKKTYDCSDKTITKEKFKEYLKLDTGVSR